MRVRDEFVTVAGAPEHQVDTSAVPTADADAGGDGAHGGVHVPAATEVLRPFVDLRGEGRCLASRTLAIVADSLDEDRFSATSQGATRADLRQTLVREAGLSDHDVESPGDLPTHLRSPRWNELADRIARWPRLDTGSRARVAALLNKLSLYRETIRLVPERVDAGLLSDEPSAALELKRIVACSKVGGASQETVRDLERVATGGAAGAALSAALVLVVHHGRFSRQADQLRRWADLAQAATSGYDDGSDVQRLRRSIVLRGISFVPMLQGDERGVRNLLDQAAELATGISPSDTLPAALIAENLFALTETRSNAAQLLGDRHRAGELADELLRLDPFNPACHLKVGDLAWDNDDVEAALRSYVHAARLGAPSTAVSWYCAARCHERLGRFEDAMALYQRSAAVDPHAVSPLLGIRRVAPRLADHATTATWVDERLRHLRALVRGGETAPAETASVQGRSAGRRPRLPRPIPDWAAVPAAPMLTNLDDLARADPADDPVKAYHLERLAGGIVRGLRTLSGLLGDEHARTARAIEEAFCALPHEQRLAAVDHPFVHFAWLKLVESIRDGRAGDLADGVGNIGRLFFVPCLLGRVADGLAFPVRVEDRQLRFPGHPVHIRLGNESADGFAFVSAEAGMVRVRGAGWEESLPLSALLAPSHTSGEQAPGLVTRSLSSVTATEIDGGDPCVRLLFQSINSKPALAGAAAYDLQPLDPAPPEKVAAIDSALGLLDIAQPPMGAEFRSYTKVIVPFTSRHVSTFTENALIGAVFLSEAYRSFEDRMFTAEHLLHEHSHLRLALVMEVDPLVRSSTGHRVRSPWRRDPRPLVGLVQGAFAFARVARFLREAAALTNDTAFSARRRDVVDELAQAVTALVSAGSEATRLGGSLIEQYKEEIDAAPL